jgi:glutamate-1-semialdehyde 2,1-aminomutase
MGNGFPIAAIAGKEEVMMTIEPGAMAHGGTYSGNVVGAAAADATLELIENQPILETIDQRGKALMNGIGDILTEAGIPHVVTGVPSMFGIFLGKDQEPRDFRDYLAGDGELYEAISMGLNQRGVQPDSDGREPWFLCYSLSEADVNETLNVFNDSVKDAKS